MIKKYYAGRHVLGREFVYDQGWTVYVFNGKQERDNFVIETNRKDYMRGYSPRSETISRDIAKKIAGSRVKEVSIPNLNFNGMMLVNYEGYYNPYYWG